MLSKVPEYIHLNPVVAGFVDQPEDWRYSSARDHSPAKDKYGRGLVELSYAE